MKPSGKTPYEIRLELLQLAVEILTLKHAAVSSPQPVAETSPTTEEVIYEAEKMNAFISKANPSH